MANETHRTASPAADRYLDLMIKTLTNVIYGDAPLPQHMGRRIGESAAQAQAAGAFIEDDRRTGRDWPSRAHTMVGVARLESLRDLTTRAILDGVPGHFIEAGVWRGGCCILMKAVVEALGASGRRVYVADSFRGLPQGKPGLFPADAGYAGVTWDELCVSAEEVRGYFAKYDLLDDEVIFLEGLFQDTLPALPEIPFALVRIDGDMYESTLVALEALYPKVSPGGFIVIDDYGAVPACRQAVDEFRARHRANEELHKIDWTGVWWRKPARARVQ